MPWLVCSRPATAPVLSTKLFTFKLVYTQSPKLLASASADSTKYRQKILFKMKSRKFQSAVLTSLHAEQTQCCVHKGGQAMYPAAALCQVSPWFVFSVSQSCTQEIVLGYWHLYEKLQNLVLSYYSLKITTYKFHDIVLGTVSYLGVI